MIIWRIVQKFCTGKINTNFGLQNLRRATCMLVETVQTLQVFFHPCWQRRQQKVSNTPINCLKKEANVYSNGFGDLAVKLHFGRKPRQYIHDHVNEEKLALDCL